MSYFGNAGQLLVSAFFGLAMIVFILRVLLQAVGANFYNPICQLLHKLTQPLIGPLRRAIPPIGRIEIAGIILVWLIALLYYFVLKQIGGQVAPFMDIAAATFPALFVAATAHVLNALLLTLFWALLIGALLSWFPVDNGNPVVPLIYQITEPLLAPFRRLLPNMPIDISPILAILSVQLLRILLVAPLFDYAQRLTAGG